MDNNLKIPLTGVINNKVVINSYEVAKFFNKSHCRIVNKIRTINCSDSFRKSNFLDTENDAVNITKNGMILLMMPYTDKRSIEIRKLFIESFDNAEIIMAETHLKTYRFLISFNEDLNMALIPLPEGTGTVNPNDKAQVLELIRHAIPMALIPDVLKEGVNRLNI